MAATLKRIPVVFKNSLRSYDVTKGLLVNRNGVFGRRAMAGANSYITNEWKNQMLREKLLRSPYICTEKIPETSLIEFIFPLMEKHRNNAMLIDGPSGRILSYHDVLRGIERVSSGLIRRGVKPGHRVVICSYNLPEYVIAFMSILACGGTSVDVNPNCTERELMQQVEATNSKFIFTHPDCAAKSIKVSKATPTIKGVISFGQSEGCIPFQHLIEDDGSAFGFPHVINNPREHLAQLPGSSGTTGLPKSVCKSHYALSAMALSLSHDALLTDVEGDVGLLVLPLYHTFPLMIILLHIMTGAGDVLLPKFIPEIFLGSIQKYKVTTTAIVPPLAIFMSKGGMLKDYDLSSIKYLNLGAAPVAPEIMNDLRDKFKLKVIRQGYGLTEICPVCIGDNGNPEVSSVGRPTPYTEVKFLHLDTGEQLGPNQKGELIAKNPTQMNGYLNNEEATKNTLKDGWIHTGDIGYYDEEGQIYIVDRLKDLIKYKGHQVAPAELESLLLGHPAVKDVAVIGVPDERAGEVPRAFVVADPEVKVTETDLCKFVADQMAIESRLYGGVKFVEVIPKSAAGKILKKDLRATL